MNSALLDPWNDAATIAERLARNHGRLVVVIGAESWCQTCRTLRPAFDALAHEQGDEVWLWLDLEEHAEFLGDFIPDDLPLLISYRGSSLTHAAVPDGATALALSETLARHLRIEHTAVPDIRSRLAAIDWAE